MKKERQYAKGSQKRQNESDFYRRYYELLNMNQMAVEIYNMVEEEHLKVYGYYRFKNHSTFRAYMSRYFKNNDRF